MKIGRANPGWYRRDRMRGLARGGILRGVLGHAVFNDSYSIMIMRSQVLGQVDDRKAFSEIEYVLKPNSVSALFGWYLDRFLGRFLALESAACQRVST